MRDVLLRDHSRTDLRLDRHHEQLLRNVLLQPLAQLLAQLEGPRAVHQEGECVDGVAHNADRQLLDVRPLKPIVVVVHRPVAPGHRLHFPNKVSHDLAKRNAVVNYYLLALVVPGEVLAPAVLT